MPGIGDKDDCDTKGNQCTPLTGTHRQNAGMWRSKKLHWLKKKKEIAWLIQDCDSPLLLSPSSTGRGICLLTDLSLQLSHAVDFCKMQCFCLQLDWEVVSSVQDKYVFKTPVEVSTA